LFIFYKGNLGLQLIEWTLSQKQGNAFVFKGKKIFCHLLDFVQNDLYIASVQFVKPQNVFHVHDTIQYRYSCCKARHDANVHDDVLLYAVA
jgi:hypothetical protein